MLLLLLGIQIPYQEGIPEWDRVRVAIVVKGSGSGGSVKTRVSGMAEGNTVSIGRTDASTKTREASLSLSSKVLAPYLSRGRGIPTVVHTGIFYFYLHTGRITQRCFS